MGARLKAFGVLSNATPPTTLTLNPNTMQKVNIESLFAALYHDGIAKLSDHYETEVEPQNEERDEQ